MTNENKGGDEYQLSPVKSHKYIPKTIKLTFDPKTLEGSEGQYFTTTARIIWLGTSGSGQQINGPKFRDKCLGAAFAIRKLERDLSGPEELVDVLNGQGIKIVPGHAEELFPYVKDKREPHYLVSRLT